MALIRFSPKIVTSGDSVGILGLLRGNKLLRGLNAICVIQQLATSCWGPLRSYHHVVNPFVFALSEYRQDQLLLLARVTTKTAWCLFG